MTSPARLLAATSALAMLLCPVAASAADPAAEAVFEEGLRAFQAGDYATACPKLATAVALTKGEGVGGMLVLAECWEKLGKTASAWGQYRSVAVRAAALRQADRRAVAEQGEARLAPLLHRLELVVAPGVASIPGLAIERDGDPVPRDAWGVGLPVDPGAIVVRITAPGRVALERTADIPATPGATRVAIDALQLAPAEVSPPLAGPQPAGSPSTPSAPSAPREGGLGTLGVAGLVTGGVGIAAIGTSIALAAVAKGQWSDAHARCSNGVCAEQADYDAVEDARGLADVGTAVFVVGAVLTAAGGTMFVIDLASDDTARAGAPPRLRLALGPTGATARGAF